MADFSVRGLVELILRQKGIKEGKEDLDKLEAEARALGFTLRRDTSKEIDNLRARAKTMGVELQKTSTKTTGLRTAVRRLATAVGAFAIGRRLVTEFRAIIDAEADFDKAMSSVRAILGATETQMARLRDQARELGRTTVFTATQVAEAQGLLSKAGFDVEEILASLPGVLDLAASGELSLGEAASIAANSIRAFGLEASNSTDVADLLAKAANTANQTVSDLGASFSFLAPVAKNLGIDMTEAAAAVSLLADRGISGQRAGRNLATALLEVTRKAQQSGGELGGLRDKLFDTEGRFVGLIKTLEVFQEAGIGSTDIIRIFGAESVRVLSILARLGPEVLEEKTADLLDRLGFSAEVAAERLDNLRGDFVRNQSAVEGLRIAIGERLDRTLRDITQSFTAVISDLTEFIEKGDEAEAFVDGLAQSVVVLADSVALVARTLNVVRAVIVDFTRDTGRSFNNLRMIAEGLDPLDDSLRRFQVSLNKTSERIRRLGRDSQDAVKDLRKIGQGIRDAAADTADAAKELAEKAAIPFEKAIKAIQDAAGDTNIVASVGFALLESKDVTSFESRLDDILGISQAAADEIGGIFRRASEGEIRAALESVTVFNAETIEKVIEAWKKAQEEIEQVTDDVGGGGFDPEAARKAKESAQKIAEATIEAQIAAQERGSKDRLDLELQLLKLQEQHAIENAADTGAKVSDIQTLFQQERIAKQAEFDRMRLDQERKNELLALKARADALQEGSEERLKAELRVLEAQREIAVEEAKKTGASEQAVRDTFRLTEEALTEDFHKKQRERRIANEKEIAENTVRTVKDTLETENQIIQGALDAELASNNLTINERIKRRIEAVEQIKANELKSIQEQEDAEIESIKRVLEAKIEAETDPEERAKLEEALENVITLTKLKYTRRRVQIEQEASNATKEIVTDEAQTRIESGLQVAQAAVALSEQLFGRNKATAVAQAIINTYEAVSKALTAAPPPFNLILAAISAAAGAAQIRGILSTDIGKGGEFSADLSGKKGGGKKREDPAQVAAGSFDDPINDAMAIQLGRRSARDLASHFRMGFTAEGSRMVVESRRPNISSSTVNNDNRVTESRDERVIIQGNVYGGDAGLRRLSRQIERARRRDLASVRIS